MKTIKIVFANIYQGLLYEEKVGQKDVFSKYRPSVYVEQYSDLQPDIVCLAEAPLDDEEGNSKFIRDFTEKIGGVDARTDVRAQSWLLEDKYYGNAIISKLPIKDYRALNLPHPHLEYDRPDGDHWVMHDNAVQSGIINLGGFDIKLFNLHYFPYFFFGRNMNEPEFAESRQAFIDHLRLADGIPTILTGDFNNGDADLETAYPELFMDDALTDAVKFDESDFNERYVGGAYQLDHILYTSDKFKVINKQVITDHSDHKGLLVELSIV